MSDWPRTFGLIVAVEEYGSRAGLVKIPGARDDARTFHDWLVSHRGAKREDIVLCTSPALPDGVEATRDEIRRAAQRMAANASDECSDLFVLYSGHGARVGPEDILMAADYEAGDGDKCIRMVQLRTELWQAMGPGSHYWFVNCCRNPVRIDVPPFTLGLRPSLLGSTNRPNLLFATVDGAPAPLRSPFHTSLEQALEGRSRAKRWRDNAYWVSYQGVTEVVRDACQKEGMEVRPEDVNPKDEIYQLESPVPDVGVIVKIRDAGPDETFTVGFSGDRYGEDRPITGPQSTVSVPPGDWWVTLKRGGNGIRYPGKVEAYDPVEIEFDLSGETGGAAAPQPERITFDLPGPGVLTVQVSQAGRPFEDVDLEGGALSDPDAGPVELLLIDRDEPVHRVEIDPAGQAGPVNLDQIRPRRPVHDLLLGAVDPPMELIADPDVASTLAVVGGEVICGEMFAPPAVEQLRQFTTLGQRQAGLYVITQCPVDWGTVASTPIDIAFKAVPGFDDLLRHTGQQVEPGLHRVRTTVDEREIELPFIAIPGHVTMVVLGTGSPADGPEIGFQPLQFALPPRHLVDLESGTSPGGLLSAIRFSALVQRRFAEGRPVMAPKPHPTHVALWRELRSGRWPDPLTMLVAAYELVRRGAIAGDPTSLVRLLGRLEERFGEHRPADLDVLWALVDRATPAGDGVPLLLDGAIASRVSVDDNPSGMALDYTGLWTRWRTWESTSAKGSPAVVRRSPRPARSAEFWMTGREFNGAMGQVLSDGARARLIRMRQLERRAQDHPEFRQAFVDELCGYPRSSGRPLTPQESQDDPVVRVAAQSILAFHLRYTMDAIRQAESYWPTMVLDLSHTNLYGLDLSGCAINAARFDRARIAGARFVGTRFTKVNFYGTTFLGEANFRGARFDGSAEFSGANFWIRARFDGASFAHEARFEETHFSEQANFTDAQFHGVATLGSVRLVGGPAWARLDIPADLAQARTWPQDWFLVPTADIPEPGAEGVWGRLIAPGVSTRVVEPEAVTVS